MMLTQGWSNGRSLSDVVFPLLLILASLALPVWTQGQDTGVQFVTEALPDAAKGEEYLDPNSTVSTIFLEATGGFTPYIFELREGALPQGLTLATNGGISGVPSRCEDGVFRVMVRDSAGTFDLRTFLIRVSAPPVLDVAPAFDPTVAAGEVTTLSLALVNSGCETVSFHAESVDFGPVVPLAASTKLSVESELATLVEMGAPVPRVYGRRSADLRRRSEGWHLDSEGRLVDGDGNMETALAAPSPEGLTSPQAAGSSVLYVNESITPGEQERMESLGFTVVEAQVPEALDLATLQGFDVLWLTAASDSIFPSREAVRQYLWEGGGLVIEQAQFSGFAGILPPGYELFMVVTPPGGDIHTLAFTPEAGSDPLTVDLAVSELPSNYDTTLIENAGDRWTFLAAQADLPEAGTLATAAMGAGRLVYHSGNLGNFTSPVASNGSDAFVSRVVDSAASGTQEVSCSWLEPGLGISDVRTDEKLVDDVQPFDLIGETVGLQLTVDTRLLLPGDYNCRLHLLTNISGQLEQTVSLTLTVSEPAAPRILQDQLPLAKPGTPYGTTLLASGGTPPYAWSLSGGGLPAGMNLEPTSGALFGTPTESGIFAPEFTLTDSLGAMFTATLGLASGFVITTETLPDATIGQVYAVPIFAAGGTPPYAFEFDETVSYDLPAEDPNSPMGLACKTTDLGGDVLSTDCDLPGMSYRVTFDTVEGYFPPAPVDVDVPISGVAELEGHYVPYGTFQVDANLEEAFYALTASTPLGDVDLLGAGLTTTFSELPPGEYIVSFASVPGYATPPEQFVTLDEGGSVLVTGTYLSVLPPDPLSVSERGALDDRSVAGFTRVSRTSMEATPDIEADIGFGDGNLLVTTDAPGARFFLVGNRTLTSLELREPEDGIGTGAAIVGRMSTVAFPVLSPGENVSIAVIASDAAGNRARRTYAPTVWNLPSVLAVTPGSAGLGQELDLRIFGEALRPSATFSLGDDVSLEVGRFEVPSASGDFVEAVARVSPGAQVERLDLVYSDPDLADTAAGSVVRSSEAVRLFTDVARIDVDGSTRVDGFDLAMVAAAFGRSAGDPLFDPALDLTNDGEIDGDDLASLGVSFGRFTLSLEAADLPPSPATVGLDYEHRIRFVGGSLFIGGVRILSGSLPDGVVLVTEQLAADPADVQDFNLLFTGIPAEAGEFTVRVQGVDAFFALFEEDITITVNP